MTYSCIIGPSSCNGPARDVNVPNDERRNNKTESCPGPGAVHYNSSVAVAENLIKSINRI